MNLCFGWTDRPTLKAVDQAKGLTVAGPSLFSSAPWPQTTSLDIGKKVCNCEKVCVVGMLEQE